MNAMLRSLAAVPLLAAASALALAGGPSQGEKDLDGRVRAFLDANRSRWHEMNVPAVDGQTLHDIIVERKYTRALEIGTSTGHSGIWIAWAMSRTGGKLITIDIDERRHREARANFEVAGLSPFIDARLGDAHVLVPALQGPFDFVFSDADKEWYTNYFVSVWPKVEPGGCFTAHNVRSTRQSGIREFMDHLKTVRDGTTTVDRSSSAGVSMTCKRRAG